MIDAVDKLDPADLEKINKILGIEVDLGNNDQDIYDIEN
jgi:hypothetical protein